MARIVSIGEVLWDVIAGSERLGGAPFNFAYHASRLGHEVIFVSAVGDDARGRAVLAKAADLGMRTDFIQVVEGAPTGIVTVALDEAGQPDFTIHRPAAYDLVQPDAAKLAAFQPDWLYYGTLSQFTESGRAAVRALAEALPAAKRFYDINLRRGSYTPQLVSELLSTALVVKLNEDEAVAIGGHLESLAARAVAVTRGSKGCAVRIGDDYAEAPALPVKVVDAVGAGDAFAAGFLHGLSQGWDARRSGEFANRLGALVASRSGGVPAWSLDDLGPQINADERR